MEKSKADVFTTILMILGICAVAIKAATMVIEHVDSLKMIDAADPMDDINLLE